jgi:hypothetical protein
MTMIRLGMGGYGLKVAIYQRAVKRNTLTALG